MPTTGYGWTASANPADFGGLVTVFDAPGQSAAIRCRKNLHIGTQDGILGDLFKFVAWRLHKIEPAVEGAQNDEWSYYFKKNSNDPNSYSQHAGGLAFDWNAMQHPNNAGPYTGWNMKQRAQVKALLAEVEYVIRWGSDYNDSMHFEIAKGLANDAGKAKIARVVKRLRATMKAHPEDFGGKPLPVPVKIVDAVASWSLAAFKGRVKVIGYNSGFPSHVKVMQTALVELGYDLGRPAVDGLKGAKTTGAVASFLRKTGVKGWQNLSGKTVSLSMFKTILEAAEGKRAGTQYPPLVEK
jgi:hypothetical protein